MSAEEAMPAVRKDNDDWTEEEKAVSVFLSEELFERLVELSVEYCATREMITTSNTNFTILHQIWCAAILPALLPSEKREVEKLTEIESIQLYKVLARAGRRSNAFYFNNGRKLAKRVGDINEKGMRDEKAAAAAAADGSGSGKGKGKKK